MSDVERKKERKRKQGSDFWIVEQICLMYLSVQSQVVIFIHVNMHGYNQMFPGKTRNLGTYIYILKNYYILCDKQD